MGKIATVLRRSFQSLAGAGVMRKEQIGSPISHLRTAAVMIFMPVLAASARAQAPGHIIMYPPSGATGPTTPWNVITPTGGPTLTITSTLTSGLQEVEDYAFKNGYSVDVYGPGETCPNGTPSSMANNSSSCGTPSNGIILALDQGLLFNPLGQRYWHFHGTNLTCTGNVNDACVTVDSCLEGGILSEGAQFIAQPNPATSASFTILFKPTHYLPIETNVNAVAGCQFNFGNVQMAASGGTAQAAVGIDAGSGSILNNFVDFLEVNGTDSVHGCIVMQNASPYVIMENTMRLGTVHKCGYSGILVGDSDKSAYYADNFFLAKGLKTGTGSNSYADYGVGNTCLCTADGTEGQVSTGFAINSSAVNTTILGNTAGGASTGVTTAISNSGTGTNGIVNGQNAIAAESSFNLNVSALGPMSTPLNHAKILNTAIVDFVSVTAPVFSCSTNPSVQLWDCDAACSSPTVINNSTMTGAGQSGTQTASPAYSIAAGRFLVWVFSAGSCSALNVGANALYHATPFH